MKRRAWLGIAIVVVVVALSGYLAYAAVEGGHELVDQPATADCRTPEVRFGWAYEAINYDIADDARLATENADLTDCTYQGAEAGDVVVTDDGVRIAGWYIPAANGAGPTAPTIVLVHGLHANKSGILPYGQALHDQFNLVAFDLRNTGRSSGDATTGGVLEQRDLRAIVDWLERTKHPEEVGVLGNSLGAATGLAEAVGDQRVDAIALDSMHTRVIYQIEARVQQRGFPAYPAAWGVLLGTWLRTGVDIGAVDPIDELGLFDRRPMLLSHGTADTQDLPERTQAFYDAAIAKGVPAELHWCEGSGHEAPAGMPAEVCRAAFGTWMSDFFTRTLR